MRAVNRSTIFRAGAAAALLLAAGGLALWAVAEGGGDAVTFTDVERQTAELIGYNDSIKLTREQEAVKRQALSALPAPCCSDNTAYTCCCPCNMALSIWGLSHYLIAEHGYDAEAVRAKVQEWIEFINPDGFSGRVCYSGGGCFRSFSKGGCGGMVKGDVVWEED